MKKLLITAVRQNLFKLVDQVIETGSPVAFERHGRTVLLVAEPAPSKLARLKKRKLIKGDPESLVNDHVGAWTELRNLE